MDYNFKEFNEVMIGLFKKYEHKKYEHEKDKHEKNNFEIKLNKSEYYVLVNSSLARKHDITSSDGVSNEYYIHFNNLEAAIKKFFRLDKYNDMLPGIDDE